MKIAIVVRMDVGIAEFSDEYAEDLSAVQVREHIRSDILEALHAAPYADAIKVLTVR